MFGDTIVTEFLLYIANGVAPTALIGLPQLWWSLHTANPGNSGNQTTSEVSYPGYTRMAVSHSSPALTVSGRIITLNTDITFPLLTGGTSPTITYAVLGTASTGTGILIASGPIVPSISPYYGGNPPKLLLGLQVGLP